MSAAVTVLASDGSATSSLVFGAPVAAVLLALLAMTLRDRLRERRDR